MNFTEDLIGEYDRQNTVLVFAGNGLVEKEC